MNELEIISIKKKLLAVELLVIVVIVVVVVSDCSAYGSVCCNKSAVRGFVLKLIGDKKGKSEKSQSCLVHI